MKLIDKKIGEPLNNISRKHINQGFRTLRTRLMEYKFSSYSKSRDIDEMYKTLWEELCKKNRI
jgi:hypothetical protein